MDKGKLKVAFIGTGGMGQCAHLKNYAQLSDECEIIALAEFKEDVGRKVAARYAIANVYASAADLLAAEKPEALVASQPFSRHGIILDELSQAGVPVFIEKPLSSSLQTGERILGFLKERKVPVMVGYHKRSDPATEFAKQEIDKLKASGKLGAMKFVRITMPAGDWIASGFDDLIHGEGEYPPIDYDPPAEDMGEATFKRYTGFVNYYIHQVNLMRHLLGEPYNAVFAEKSGVLFAGESESGIACVIEMTPYRTTIDWQEEALVAFENGYVKLGLAAPLASNRPGQVEILKDPGDGAVPMVKTPHLPWVHAMKNQALNFIKFARGEAAAPCEAEEALEDLKVAREYIRLLTDE